jgi:hypothetical protein
MTIISQMCSYRDGVCWESSSFAKGGDTVVTGRLIQSVGECFEISAIGILLFSDDNHLIPLNHPLWLNSLFKFQVRTQIIFDGPAHKFADPITHLALSPAEFETLDSEIRWRFIGKLGFRLEQKYMMESQLPVAAILQPRCNMEDIPRDGKLLVILDGKRQRVII